MTNPVLCAGPAAVRSSHAAQARGDGRPRKRRTLIRQALNRRNVSAAWAVLLVAVVHPPHGLGVSLCWVRASAGTLCPGCGLTRSMSSAARGMWEQSWAYHPFGIALLAIFMSIAVFGVLPARRRRPIHRFLLRHRTASHLAGTGLIAAFITYGVLRAAAAWMG